MDDLIRRADAINAMGDYLEQLNVSRRYAKSIINKCPSAQQWIPCNDSLPDEMEMVLISMDRDNQTVGRIVRMRGELVWQVDYHEYPIYAFDAWMPLPEPYADEYTIKNAGHRNKWLREFQKYVNSDTEEISEINACGLGIQCDLCQDPCHRLACALSMEYYCQEKGKPINYLNTSAEYFRELLTGEDNDIAD